MTELIDFAGALRQMAANAETLANRHDLRHVAQLYQQVDDQAAAARRNADLVTELRRQVEAMGRVLDGIGRMRRVALNGDQAAVQILADALFVIDGQCEHFTSSSCRSDTSGKTRGAPYLADAWCMPCVARDALERAGALPPAVD